MKAAAAEYLRQQREAFDQNKAQAAQWFALRLRMAYTCLVLTVVIGGGCGSIIFWHEHFPNSAVAAAVAGLSIDVLGMLAAV